MTSKVFGVFLIIHSAAAIIAEFGYQVWSAF